MKTNKNNTAKNVNVNKANVAETKNTTTMKTTETKTAMIDAADLETAEVEIPATLVSKNFSDIEWLAKNDPEYFFSPEVCTNKYNADREPSIAAGLGEIAKIGILDPKLNINPLVILLGKWWEVKPARAEIKKMIDADAKKMGVTSDVFIQITLRQQVEKYADIGNAADRMSYAINFYKPRRALNEKVEMKRIRINGEVYEVAVPELIKAKEMYADNADELRAYVLTIATKPEAADIDEI